MPIPVQDSNLSNLCSSVQLPHNSCDRLFRALTLRSAQMINLPLIGVATALVVCAIMARVFAHGNQKAEKPQKAEIIKQLLALSDRENRLTGTAPSVPPRAPLSNEPTRPGSGPRRAAPKISQPPLRSNLPLPKSLSRN